MAKFLDHDAVFRAIVLPAARNSSFQGFPGGSGTPGINTGGVIDSHDAINIPNAPPSAQPTGAPVIDFITQDSMYENGSLMVGGGFGKKGISGIPGAA